MISFIAQQIYKGITEIEVFWVILAAFGFAFSAYNTYEAWKDVRAVDGAKIHNGRRMIATTARFQDACRAVVHAIFLAIGFAAWTYESAPLAGQPWNIVLLQILIRWGLIVAAAILVAQSYASYHLRKNIIEREKYDLDAAAIKAELEKTYISKAVAADELETAADVLRESIEET